MALTDIPWIGLTDDKLYLQSGKFTSTLKTSQYIGAIDAVPDGISFDGTNTPWIGQGDDKLYLQSGQFTSTIKTSEYVGGIDISPDGISFDGTDTPWAGIEASQLYLQSGQFTSTIKTSEYVGGIDTFVNGISYDGTDTPWSGEGDNKLYLQSGQFTSTLITSEYVGGIDGTPTGISYDGTNTLWSGDNNDKLYLQSGQFTSTIKTSEYVGGIDTRLVGIDTNDVNARLTPPVGTTGDVAITLPILIVQAGSGATGHLTLPVLAVQGLGGATGSIILPIITVSSAGHMEANASITLPLLNVLAASEQHGFGDVDLPILIVNATGLQGEVGNFANALFTLPFNIQTRGYNGSAPECVVMNTKNFAVTEYMNYGFNSMTRFNGANLVADQNGIYEQDNSDTDHAGIDDYKIKAHVKSGRFDIHKGSIQKLRNGWLNYQTDGDVQIVVRADKKATRYYMLPFHTGLEGINERRVKFERGIRNRFFDFKIQNIAGSQIEIDRLTITLEPVVSKRR